tara:strand:+ start:4440 stop:4604 length:165 start_codon:yes stop_codon:yes gene_type:complete
MSLTLDEIIERLATRYGHEEICDLLGVSTERLLWALEDEVAANYDKLNEEVEYD